MSEELRILSWTIVIYAILIFLGLGMVCYMISSLRDEVVEAIRSLRSEPAGKETE